MYNLLIISHGSLAEEFLNTTEMIMGTQDNITTLGLKPEEGKEDFEKTILETCEKIYNSDGILVLADLYGGTPCNSAILKLLTKYDRVQIVAGLNLAMLIQAIMYRNENLENVVMKLKQDSIDAIHIINKEAFNYED